ncbi:WD40 repeat domain-containing protein [Microcoleus sp. A003_D6]|uniref:WD40 repeat domain-containing protein n=1 Tax=Microcoleus sp. A003_D6 TaxID=3055266 RepID=UPI002FD75D70
MGRLAERLKQLPQGSRIYKLKALPKLLAQASQVDRLYILLTDFDFIEAKISELGPQPLIEDYDLAFTPDILNSEEWVKSKGENLRIIQSALRLSAHILEQDNTRLTAQLLGRLSPLEASEIKPLLEQAAKQCQLHTKLRPLTPSLTQPSNRLVRTLVGHTRTVTDVVVTPDGQHAISASVDRTLRIWNLKTGEMLQTLEDHTIEMTAIVAKSAMAIAITPKGCRAISASADAVSVWNLKNTTKERTFKDPTSNGWSVAITPDGQLVISAFGAYALKL